MGIELIKSTAQDKFTKEVCTGLTKSPQKELPSKYLYDAVGSALFEVISLLPEYGVTRAEERILGRHATRMVSELPAPVIVAELGSGAGKKTRVILEALSRKQPISYYPIEIFFGSPRNVPARTERHQVHQHCRLRAGVS